MSRTVSLKACFEATNCAYCRSALAEGKACRGGRRILDAADAGGQIPQCPGYRRRTDPKAEGVDRAGQLALMVEAPAAQIALF